MHGHTPRKVEIKCTRRDSSTNVHECVTRNLTSVTGRMKSPDIARLFCCHLIFTPQPRYQPRHAPVNTMLSHLLRPNHLFSSNCHEASQPVRGPIIGTMLLHALPHCSPRTCIGHCTKENVEGLLMSIDRDVHMQAVFPTRWRCLRHKAS